MKDFKKAIKEINNTLNFLIVFESILNTTIFFLVVYFLLSLVNLFPILAIIPALIYFVIRLIKDSKLDKRKIVESKYAPLNEKLRTAADNMKAENPVVDELEEEVIQDLKQVGLSSFINTKNMTYKIFFVILMSFAIVAATTTELYIVDLNKFLSDLPEYIDSVNPRKSDNILLGDINESEDIYGKSKLAILGNEEIEIRIKPANFEVNVRAEGDFEQRQFDEIFPKEVNVDQSSSFEEKIPEEEQELVKNYFNKIANR